MHGTYFCKNSQLLQALFFAEELYIEKKSDIVASLRQPQVVLQDKSAGVDNLNAPFAEDCSSPLLDGTTISENRQHTCITNIIHNLAVQKTGSACKLNQSSVLVNKMVHMATDQVYWDVRLSLSTESLVYSSFIMAS